MLEDIEFFIKILALCLLTTLVFSIVSYANSSCKLANSESIVTEGTVVDKQVSTRYLSTGKAAVPVRRYSIVSEIAEGKYSITTTADLYNELDEGDSMLFNVHYSDNKVTSVTLASDKDLVEELSTE